MSSRRVMVGVDEAGRGSLVGDLFVAAVAVASDCRVELAEAGVRDSKLLSRSRRYDLLLKIIECSEAIVVSRITPEDIDRENINDLEVKAIERSMKHLRSRGLIPARVAVDEIAGREKLVEAVCRRYFPEAEVIMRPNADRDFVEVSAASIVAKTMRDSHIRTLSRTYGEIGSGYPADPRTINWLNRVRSAGLPKCVRMSWKTVRRSTSRTLDEFAKK
jgi:ribonuclease HII